MFKAICFGLCLAVIASVADHAQALGGPGDTSASFNVTIKGIRAGRLTINARMNGAQYSAATRLKSTGIVAALTKFQFDASGIGRMVGPANFRPSKYTEQSDTGRRQSNMTMSYRNGIPTPNVTSPAPALSGSGQGGTIDPMSAIFSTFRDQGSNTLCQANHVIYDGKRRTQLSLRPKSVSATTATCIGTYTRLGGFSAARMADGTEFPIKIEYSGSNGNYQVETLTIESTRGRAVFSRR